MQIISCNKKGSNFSFFFSTERLHAIKYDLCTCYGRTIAQSHGLYNARCPRCTTIMQYVAYLRTLMFGRLATTHRKCLPSENSTINLYANHWQHSAHTHIHTQPVVSPRPLLCPCPTRIMARSSSCSCSTLCRKRAHQTLYFKIQPSEFIGAWIIQKCFGQNLAATVRRSYGRSRAATCDHRRRCDMKHHEPNCKTALCHLITY